MTDKLIKSEAEWRSQLSPDEYHVLREAGTERAFTGVYWNSKDKGTYECRACGQELFSSDTKYDSGSGWPSFYDVLDQSKVTLKRDVSHGMVRTEVCCARCDSHLGHVFPDGPGPTGQRYCINSLSLNIASDEGGA